MSIKGVGLAIIAIVIGSRIAFVLFSITFNAPIDERPSDLLEPMALAIGGSFALGYIENAHWRRMAIFLAAPAVAMCATIATMLVFEERWDPVWLMLAAAVVMLCVGGGWTGRMLSNPRTS